ARQRGLHDAEAHPRQRLHVLIAVHPDLEVDLGDPIEAATSGDVDQQAQLDAVPGGESQLLQQLAPAGVLAGERLHDAGQIRQEEVEHRARDQLGYPPAAGRVGDLPLPDGTFVEGLDVLNALVGQQRADQPVHEAGVDVLDVRVHPADDV